MTPKTKRAILLGLMNIVVIVALALVARVIVEFFGSASASIPGDAVVALTAFLVPPLGIESLTTPYGGVFDVEAAVMFAGLLVSDWVLGIVRRHE